MSNEWLDVAYINSDEAILHGQIVIDGREQEVRSALSSEQKRAIEDLNWKQQQEMTKLLRGMAA